MRDPRLTNTNPGSHFTSFPSSASSHPSRTPSTPASAAATTYLASREQHLQGPFSSQPLPHYQRPRMDERPSRHAEAPATVRWTTSTSSLQEPPAPPPPVHRVYVLRCASCDTFLSDRGMRAVLLLKPNIVLFSTDAHPCNASTLAPEKQQELAAERTCNCLTSSIACHGCGCTVGYHIVSPCARCTASVQKHQRSANHHRFVFHHDQVTFSERRCFEGETGVVQTAPIRSYSPSPSSRGSSPSPSTSPDAHGAYSDFKDAPAPVSNLRVPSQRGADGGRSPSPTPPSRREGLNHGDVVYWHNLVAGGERAEPIDPKARPYAIPPRAGR
ncbi:FAM72 protein-domain-containing protein [Leucosporidium creatinivorum]|uniref:FAM72 protein-domain-containing protein n=1 Tax=Leucosporidium creatinivorum TaxID=106004 RepID=A0A1Y2FZH3_9BASI|nr:FAM72 protein-domain-containing protein [Leucosporidium creatinivorum]